MLVTLLFAALIAATLLPLNALLLCRRARQLGPRHGDQGA